MLLDLNHIGQIALPVTDVDRAEAFYSSALGLRRLPENKKEHAIAQI